MAYAKYNYLGSTTQSQTSILSDVGSILSGVTNKAQLFGHINLSSAAVGITNTSTTVTWVGADDGSVFSQRKNIEVGQAVFGTGIPDGTTVATITNQTGFTLSAAATATNAIAILTLDDTATLPISTIGSTTKTISTSSGSANLTITGMCTATLGICAVGMSVEGFGIPNGTTISSITSANVLVMSNTATATVSPASIVLSAPSTAVTCDTANTTISAAYNAAGWKLYDMYGNAGVANVWIFRAPVIDDSTFYKYMALDVQTAGYIQMHNYETWNNSSATHTGTNQSTAFATGYQQRITPTVPATLAIGASVRYCVMQSIVAAGTGGLTQGSWNGLFERTRATPWDTVANGYPPVVLSTGYSTSINSQNAVCPRYKNPAGGDYATASCILGWCSLGASNGTISSQTATYPISKIPDGVGGFYSPLNDLHFRYSLNGFLGGSISQVCDVWGGVSYASNLDEMTANGKTYIAWNFYTSVGNFFIPKG